MDSEKYLSGMQSEQAPRGRVSLPALFQVFLTVGTISFGGGAIAYLREYVVRSRRWMSDEEFLDALEVSETLPGLNTVNLSVIIGDRLRGALGAALAVAGITVPGAIVVLGLAELWEGPLNSPRVGMFLTGAAVVACGLLTAVTLQLGRRQLASLFDLALVGATFAAISLFHLPLWLVLLLLAPVGIWFYRPTSGRLQVAKPKVKGPTEPSGISVIRR